MKKPATTSKIGSTRPTPPSKAPPTSLSPSSSGASSSSSASSPSSPLSTPPPPPLSPSPSSLVSTPLSSSFTSQTSSSSPATAASPPTSTSTTANASGSAANPLQRWTPDEELRIAFGFFDKEHRCAIPVSDAMVLFRSLGQSPTKKEIEDLCTKTSDQLGLATFLEYMAVQRLHPKSVSKSDLTTAFRCFDSSGTGKLRADDLQSYLTELGDDPFNNKQAMQFIKEFADTKGLIEISTVVDKMFV
ncbi:hypothetical protein Pelo_13408 [Pelomyxa schiedti]|nr:hypothetical protein Pelo_13408 [Pelomyxa schiedti]